jgi:hypothetical protein
MPPHLLIVPFKTTRRRRAVREPAIWSHLENAQALTIDAVITINHRCANLTIIMPAIEFD